MVELPKDCVLQWAGHAGYITERFSGLLARQALVDVTLVCDEQKLRVHKLVLASNSVYFEEILQQDLGQEPIIFLKDLDFEILKAMVEFMYCGETTVSYQHLASLLTAANIFKVKELVSVIDTIVGTKKIVDAYENCLKQQGKSCNLKVANSSLTENDFVRVRYDKLSDEGAPVCAVSNNDVCSTKNQSLEDDVIDDIEHNSKHTLYEEADAIDVNSRKSMNASSSRDVNISWQCHGIANTVSTQDKVKEQTRCAYDEAYYNDLKPILYEQCCDLSDVNERDQTFSSTTLLSQSCLPQVESDFEHCSDESDAEVSSSKIGKCIKVYTHKRRRSVDEVRSKLVSTRSLVPSPPLSTDSIDLLEEPSTNDVPVTMLTSLDMESAEYILSLSAESIQSIVGGTISDQHTVIGFKELNATRDANKEQSSIADCTRPILRRSMRLNQQENDEATSSNISSVASAGIEKPFRNSNSPNRTEYNVKVKRKGREDRKVPDHGTMIDVQSGNRRSFRSKRSNSRLIVKKSSKSVCTAGKEKEEPRPRAVSNRLRVENTEKLLVSDSAVSPIKSDVVGGISRGLWGDMSDALDSRENETNLLAYPSNTEIPFAVGLLPLRTALEKMQATPDYQPRKTRSSVAPMKQDVGSGSSSGLKRKMNYTLTDVTMLSRKNCNNNESPKTAVCHIQIKAAPSQDTKNRKSRFLPEPIASLPATDLTNKQ